MNSTVVGKPLRIPLNVKVAKDSLLVNIMSPNGKFYKTANLTQEGEGKFIIDFLGEEVGLYTMQLMVNGELKSTVPVEVQEASVTMQLGETEQATAYVGSEFEYTLELPADVPVKSVHATFMHSSGAKEETTISRGSGNNFVLKFIPQMEGYYTAPIDISGHGIIGHVKVLVNAAPKLTLKVSTKGAGNDRVKVGSKHVFCIEVQGIKIDKITAYAVTPTGATHNTEVVVTGRESLEIGYTPNAPGDYLVNLQYEGGSFSGPLKFTAV